MAYLKTAYEWEEFFRQLPADELIAVPFVWQKDDAEAVLTIVNNDMDIELSDDEWSWAVSNYENNERFNEDSTETMSNVLMEIVDSRAEKEGK